MGALNDRMWVFETVEQPVCNAPDMRSSGMVFANRALAFIHPENLSDPLR